MIESGFLVLFGIAFLMLKRPRRLALRLLKHDLAIDIAVSLLVFLIHFGTFSGLMAATVAGLLTSLATSGAKKIFGYIDGKNYVQGVIRLKV
jgi:nucleoside permease NupC